MDLKLEDIKKIVSEQDFDNVEALLEHHKQLIGKRNQMDQLISTVEKTVAYYKGEIKMSNEEKFQDLKREKLKENERNYGKEVREKYGEVIVEASNKRFGSSTLFRTLAKRHSIKPFAYSGLTTVSG